MLLLGCVNVCMCYFLCKRDGSKFWINSVKNLQGCRAAWLETSIWSVTRAWGGWSQSQLPEGYAWVLPEVGATHLRLLGLKYLLLQQGEELDILCLASYLVIEIYMKMKQAELGASVLMISGFTSGSNFWKHYVPLRGGEPLNFGCHCLKHFNLDLYFLLGSTHVDVEGFFSLGRCVHSQSAHKTWCPNLLCVWECVCTTIKSRSADITSSWPTIHKISAIFKNGKKDQENLTKSSDSYWRVWKTGQYGKPHGT